MSEYSDENVWKCVFSIENFDESHSRKIFRYHMKILKVSKSYPKNSFTRPRKSDGLTTRRSRDMQLKVKKIEFFKVFNSQNILTKIFEILNFQWKIFFKVALEKFSDVIWKCWRYLKASPNIALCVREKITTIQQVYKKYSRKT